MFFRCCEFVPQNVQPFTEKQIDLLKTFADQAVIAIENVRLFDEVQAKTRDLEEALQFQTASAEVLKVISRSPDALQPVLDVIVAISRQLCNSLSSVIFLLRDSKFHVAAKSGTMPKSIAFLRTNPIAFDQRGSSMARAAREKRTDHVPNTAEDPEFDQSVLFGVGNPRALLSVPLMHDGKVIGGITFEPIEHDAIHGAPDRGDRDLCRSGGDRDLECQAVRAGAARTRELTKSLDDLRTAQDRLVQTEKLASLGQLTAGIAHEIKNPLNFVNNFSALSVELVDEMNEVLVGAQLEAKKRVELDEIRELLKSNLEKVVQHGKRAELDREEHAVAFTFRSGRASRGRRQRRHRREPEPRLSRSPRREARLQHHAGARLRSGGRRGRHLPAGDHAGVFEPDLKLVFCRGRARHGGRQRLRAGAESGDQKPWRQC